MHTERFNKLRKKTLGDIFSTDSCCNIWRRIVRNQLRQLDIKDLYDHYDFNYNIEERSKAIRNDILNGTYKVSLPLIYRIEKKYGVCRHLVIPQPTDSLVLQVLVEKVASKILLKQPSKNSFYSRDKHNVGKPHDAFEYGLGFREQWKKLQKKIYSFNKEKELIVVTDLSNYYDSINIAELQKVFHSYVETDEVVVDLLFRIIEEISWKPDYLPYLGKGLPTTNLEAIRLLAHSFLYEIDEVLKQKTDDNFARWMDDFIIGVDDRKEAIETISAISDMLKSRGLALNLAKTDIYDHAKAEFHFQIEENLFLDSLEQLKKGDVEYNKLTTELKKRFKKHIKDTSPKYWDKVSKRYITAFKKAKSPKLLTEIEDTYLAYPSLRPSLLIYLAELGYSKKATEKLESILDQIDIFDDISLYQICHLLTLWNMPTDSACLELIARLDQKITSISFKRSRALCFYSCLWFKAKYNHPEDLANFINKYANIWHTDTFLRRQTTAIISRLMVTKKEQAEPLLKSQISSGIPNTVTIANQILEFNNIKSIDKKLSWYLFPKVKQVTYPLPKFLVLCSVLNSESIRTSDEVKKQISEHIDDHHYKKWLDLQYNIQF